MAANADPTYMSMALEQAEKGRGRTFPNPMVGAVIVKAGKIVGQGYHQAAGKPHAEIEAIKSAGNKSNGATLYVTLEPCCHTGRTGPCTDAIIAAGIKKVVYATKDPDKRVSGKGSRLLKKHGIEVLSGIERTKAIQQNDAYFGYYSLGRPYVTLKIAQTLDGRIATGHGDSKWITSLPARKHAHLIRAQSDGIIIGANTVRVDDPDLTVRHVKGVNPYRIVVSSDGKIPRKSKLITQNQDGLTIIAAPTFKTSKNTSSSKIFWKVKKQRDGNVEIVDLIACAKEFGLRSLMVEGGAALATSFLKAKLVDKIILFVAPKIIGTGKNSIGDLGIKKIVNSLEFANYSHQTVGPDSIFTGYPVWDKIMFTGLIQTVGTIKTIRKDADYLHLAIASDFDLSDVEIGESMSCDGACLTVTKKSGEIFEVAASSETADRTILASYRSGTKLNLERALSVGDRLGGHYVTGHIDARGKIQAVKPVGKSVEIKVIYDQEFDKLVVPKGSIAINGLSLTVNEVSAGLLSVNIIPHTISATTIAEIKVGSDVNLEFDLIGKYVVKFNQPYVGQPLTKKKLKESGW